VAPRGTPLAMRLAFARLVALVTFSALDAYSDGKQPGIPTQASQ
jgi:hypothetical protein